MWKHGYDQIRAREVALVAPRGDRQRHSCDYEDISEDGSILDLLAEREVANVQDFYEKVDNVDLFDQGATGTTSTAHEIEYSLDGDVDIEVLEGVGNDNNNVQSDRCNDNVQSDGGNDNVRSDGGNDSDHSGDDNDNEQIADDNDDEQIADDNDEVQIVYDNDAEQIIDDNDYEQIADVNDDEQNADDNDNVDSGDGNDDDSMTDDDNGDNESVIIISSDNDEIGDVGTIVVADSRTVIQTFVLTVIRRQRYVHNNLVDTRVTLEK